MPLPPPAAPPVRADQGHERPLQSPRSVNTTMLAFHAKSNGLWGLMQIVSSKREQNTIGDTVRATCQWAREDGNFKECLANPALFRPARSDDSIHHPR